MITPKERSDSKKTSQANINVLYLYFHGTSISQMKMQNWIHFHLIPQIKVNSNAKGVFGLNHKSKAENAFTLYCFDK